MIVPERRLIIWSAIVLLPCGLSARWFPAASGVVLLVYLLLAVFDAMRASRPLRAIEIALPTVIRLARRRPGKIPAEIRNGGSEACRLRLALVFPVEIEPETAELRVEAGPSTRIEHEWGCQALRRGRYVIEQSVVETLSPLKLWAVRVRRSHHCEVRVYPDLLGQRKKTAALLLRGSSGIHLLRQLGQGREFEKLREYVPGDSYGEIHWKATAKRGRPITKLYQVEKTREVYIVIDTSRLSARLVAERRKKDQADPVLEYFLSASLILALAAQRQGDLFGLVVYSDQVRRFLPAGTGKQHFDACRQALYDLEPAPVSPDLQELSSFIGLRLRRRALLIFLTDLDDPVLSEGFVRNVRVLARRHLVLVNVLKSAGLGRVFEEKAHSIDDVYRSLAGQIEWQRTRELQATLSRIGVRMEQLQPEWLAAELISLYLNVKQRQLL